jgi:hypothetical protein
MQNNEEKETPALPTPEKSQPSTGGRSAAEVWLAEAKIVPVDEEA